MQTTPEQIRADQRAAAQSMDDTNDTNVVNGNFQSYGTSTVYRANGTTDTRTTLRRPAPPKHKTAVKGHEAFLKALEGVTVAFTMAGSGDVINGVIKTSDKYTVSIQEAAGTRVLFKHDISEFYVLAPVSMGEAH